MKAKFTSVDIAAILPELNNKLKGLRVNQVYDVDHRTYLIRFNTTTTCDADDVESANKIVLLLESGSRFHTTNFQWPKSFTPSGFTMKLRKHLKNKRLEHIRQLGADRIVDLQFGSGEAAYHIVLELYDRGNILITDYEWVILNILRPRTESGEDSDVRFAVREKYPAHLVKRADDYAIPSRSQIAQILSASKAGDNLRKIFVPKLIFGPALIEHSFIEVGLGENAKVHSLDLESGPDLLITAFKNAEELFHQISANELNTGYIILSEERKTMKGFDPNPDQDKEMIDLDFREFHPHLFSQFKLLPDSDTAPNSKCGKRIIVKKFASFDEALDHFFSSIKGQKLDSRQRQLEKEALMKLDRVRIDHEKRLEELANTQKRDEQKADLIITNSDLVEEALTFIRNALHRKSPWSEIEAMVRDPEQENEAVKRIRSLDLTKNTFDIELWDPFVQSGEDAEGQIVKEVLKIDIDLSSFANARRYHDKRKFAATKEDKTIKSSAKALKSAQFKTQTALKEVAVKTSIQKSRKVYWFEKFYWCISSENYLMIAGRDAQQNELVVKRYMKPGDVYVHGDLHGAASVVVKNNDPSREIPPRTLEEAATMAVCHSSAWDAKIVARSWWVRPDQVSKTAPSGEYLSVGAFMIRGKKNYLPLTQLVLGFGFLFKLDEESADRHRGERSGKPVVQLVDDGPVADVEVLVSDEEEEEQGSDAETEAVTEFPDTKVRTMSTNSDGVDDEMIIVSSAAPRVRTQVMKLTRKIVRNAQKAHQNQQLLQKQQQVQSETSSLQTDSRPNNELSRSQRSKMKKIKKKYKDQDEEDRMIRMAILGKTPSGQPLDKNKKKNRRTQKVQELTDTIRILQNKNPVDSETQEEAKDGPEELLVTRNDSPDVQIPDGEETNQVTGDSAGNSLVAEDEDEDMDEEQGSDSDVEKSSSGEKVAPHIRLLESLTGNPTPDDNMLFCIPVVGPYSSLMSYKFKVKVVPGNNRRGKAAKTALHLFTMDRNISQREKDLLKNAKDMDISKNLPAKIKITTSAGPSHKKH